MKKVLIVTGPTAVGKSDLAVRIAKQFQTEIISGDAIQVYKGFDIGSGKITPEEMQGIKHHLLDILDAKEGYSVADFQRDCRKLIDEIEFPIICGGTGLYLKGALYDYRFENEENTFDATLEEYQSETLYAMLQERDYEQSLKIHPHNKRRIIRALTLIANQHKKMSEVIENQAHTPLYDTFWLGCTMAREDLYNRINRRVAKMFEDGLEEEVRKLHEVYPFDAQAFKGIGYREWEGYFQGKKKIDEVKCEIQRNARRYAKRQYTWLNHQVKVRWVDMQNKTDIDAAIDEIEKWSKIKNVLE